jgi:hypothetical protein
MHPRFYICYNDVSYVVAAEHVLQSTRVGDATILHAADRVGIRPRYAHLRHRRLTRANLALACARLAVARNGTVYVPHHRLPRSVRWMLRCAGASGLVDDGLDTLRERPRNIDVESVDRHGKLLTFNDYPALASWTSRLQVERVCSLDRLVREESPCETDPSWRTIVVDSPGVDVSRLPAELAPDPATQVIYLHDNPKKRNSAPAARTTTSRVQPLENAMAGFDGAIVSGESMATVFALFVARRARLIVQLTRSQYDNLACLHAVIRASGATLCLH